MIVGLIVNPIAGLGGPLGLKGSDGVPMDVLVRAGGAVSYSEERARRALAVLARSSAPVEILTPPGAMGERAARAAGLPLRVVGTPLAGPSTAEDTRSAAGEIARRGAGLILFAGGDGTARDMLDALGRSHPVLGIPSGVKMYSAAFAVSPVAAGDVAAAFVSGRVTLEDAEVMDIDEAQLRRGVVAARLYGFVNMPRRTGWVQGAKVRTALSDESHARAIAAGMARNAKAGETWILGPGTTLRHIKNALGVDGTLAGVDVSRDGHALCLDADERALLDVVARTRPRIVVTPVGGQGYVFGRGNQPISAEVLRRTGVENVTIVATPAKLNGLHGAPLLVDTGDDEVDRMLSGYATVRTGSDESCIYRLCAASHTENAGEGSAGVAGGGAS